MSDAQAVARRLAADVLFPAALEVDRADSVPKSHLDAIAAAGLYGLSAPTEAGGLALDLPSGAAVVEALASGCLATTFVWLQHHGLVRMLAATGPTATGPIASGPTVALRDRFLPELAAGRIRSGIALTGLWPGEALLRARPVDGGWQLDGQAPWVSGWGMVDVLQVAARGPDGTVVWLLLDAGPTDAVRATRQHLVAVDASRTVHLEFRAVFVPDERHLGIQAYDGAAWSGGPGLRMNGSLALGVAARCVALMGSGPLEVELDLRRRQLDEAPPESMADARAAACDLAWRAAGALAVHRGSQAVRMDEHAQRLAREALFVLVFGSRQEIRSGLLARLIRP